MIGKVGRVTGTVKPGSVGEVTLEVGGGTSAYHAYPVDGESTFNIGSRVLVVDFQSPQTVYVELYAL